MDNVKTLFQFHEGPIKTNGGRLYRNISHGFNSMKVRLKRKTAHVHAFQLTPFQFHEGPIKTGLSRRGRALRSVSIP